MCLYIYLGWSYPWSLKVLSDGVTVNAETNELIKVLRTCQEPNWPYFMFRVHLKDRLRFWLLLSYWPWRDQVGNGHCALPEEENISQLPEIHLGRMPGLRGKSHLLTSSPACIRSLRKLQFGGPWTSWSWPRSLRPLSLFLCPSLLGCPVETPAGQVKNKR